MCIKATRTTVRPVGTIDESDRFCHARTSHRSYSMQLACQIFATRRPDCWTSAADHNKRECEHNYDVEPVILELGRANGTARCKYMSYAARRSSHFSKMSSGALGSLDAHVFHALLFGLPAILERNISSMNITDINKHAEYPPR